MSNTQINPFFLIVGAPRSGTTLVNNMLSAHPQVFIFPQTQFFNKIWGARHIYNFKKNRSKILTVISRDTAVKKSGIDLFSGENASKNTFEDYFQEYLDLINDYNFEHKQYIGDKTPRHMMLLKKIKTNLPGHLKIVAVVRDSRAVIASMKARNLIKNVASGSAIWNAYAREATRLSSYLERDDFVLLRYEDIIDNPESSAKKIAAGLNIPYRSEMIDINDNNSSFIRHNRSGIFNDSLTTWKTKLTTREINDVNCLTGYYLEHFGYQMDKADKKAPSPGVRAAYFLSKTEDIFIMFLIKAGLFPSALSGSFLKAYFGRP